MAKIYVNGDAQEVSLPLNVRAERAAARDGQRAGERGVCRARGLGEYSTEGRRQGRFPLLYGRWMLINDNYDNYNNIFKYIVQVV